MRKTKRPKFSNHFGRTWDTIDFFADGQRITGHLDTTWGGRIYFPYAQAWYSIDREYADSHSWWNEVVSIV